MGMRGDGKGSGGGVGGVVVGVGVVVGGGVGYWRREENASPSPWDTTPVC